jgi:hypothetical protein
MAFVKGTEPLACGRRPPPTPPPAQPQAGWPPTPQSGWPPSTPQAGGPPGASMPTTSQPPALARDAVPQDRMPLPSTAPLPPARARTSDFQGP